MKKEHLLFVGMALIIGVLVGILISRGGRDREAEQLSPSPAVSVNGQQDLRALEQLVAGDPGNRSAWVELGHKYFDGNEPVKAIEAYNKALALDGNDPDVLTDQGVMFRTLGWYDRAVENFNKANELNPRHHQSLYNLGVVYRYDLHDDQQARKAWTRYLEIAPNDPGADHIRQELDALSGASTLAPPK